MYTGFKIWETMTMTTIEQQIKGSRRAAHTNQQKLCESNFIRYFKGRNFRGIFGLKTAKVSSAKHAKKGQTRKFIPVKSRQNGKPRKKEKVASKHVSTLCNLRVRLSMEIVRSTILCVRGSRKPFRRNENIAEDIRLENVESGVF